MSKFQNLNVASLFEIRHNQGRTQLEIARIKALLSDDWDPRAIGDITDEYILLSPLMRATFISLINSPVSTSRRAIFFTKALSGVAFLHSHGLCHRDIKPGNTLIPSYDPPEALLCDFGCVSDKPEIMYDSPGTVSYLAPEQKPGLLHGPTVDYWACGLVGYELLAQETTRGRVEAGVVLDRYHQVLDSLNADMAQCCKMMLDLDPTQRMPAEDAVIRLELTFLQDGEEDGGLDYQSISNKRKLR
ncbi:kinase-like domain-containing protein [Phaeosphaeriaceae sp. PMI808]|nr:kinase-like domain-containing protein [Phaeosphaeriaceae sp. PMI808]